MTEIMDYLPGIPDTYWKNYVHAIEPTKPKVILPGQRNVSLIPTDFSEKHGLILEFVMGTNNPDIEFIVVADNTRIHATMSQMYESGYSGFYLPTLPWLSEYNTTTNVYMVNLLTELPFRHNVFAYVSNNTTSSITITSMGFNALIFNDGFYKKLAELKNGKE